MSVNKFLLIAILFSTVIASVVSKSRPKKEVSANTNNNDPATYDHPWDQQWDAPEIKFEEDYHIDLQVDPHGKFHDGTFDQEEETGDSTKFDDEWTETKKSRMKSLEAMSSWADCEERDTCYSSYELPFAARNCFCDPHCIIYNDCCPDSPSLMEGKPPGLPNITSESVSCQILDNVRSDAEFYVVNKCPAGYRDEYVKRRCEQAGVAYNDLFHKVYVSSEKSEILYRNVYCALCHGENKKLKFWQVVKNCPLHNDEHLMIDFTLSSFQKLESQVNDSCKLELVPPPYVLPRKCKSYVGTCPNAWEGRRENELCQAGSTSYVYTERVTYKNKYCAICNDEDEAKLSCKDSRSTASQFDFAFSEDAAVKPTGLWLVTDLTETFGYVRTPTHFGQPVKLGNCRETGQIFDPFRKPEVCRRIRCDDDGFKYWAGKCIEKVKTTTTLIPTTIFKTSKKPPTKPRTSKFTKLIHHSTTEIQEIPDVGEITTIHDHQTTTTTEATAIIYVDAEKDVKPQDVVEDMPEVVNENVDIEFETTTTSSSYHESFVDSFDETVNNGEEFEAAVASSQSSKLTTEYDDEYQAMFRETPPMRGVRKRKPTTTEPRGETDPPHRNALFEDEVETLDDLEVSFKLQVPTTVAYEVMDISTPGNELLNPVYDSSTSTPKYHDVGKHDSSRTKSKGRPNLEVFDCLEWQTIGEYDYQTFENHTLFVFSLYRLFDIEEVRELPGVYSKDVEVCLRRMEISSDIKPDNTSAFEINVTALEPTTDLLIMFHYDRPLGLTSLILTIIALVGLIGTMVGMLSPSFVRKTLTTKCVVSLCFASFVAQCLYLCSSVISNLEHQDGADIARIHSRKPAQPFTFCFWNGVSLHYFVLASAFWMNSFVIAFARKNGNLEKKNTTVEEELNLKSKTINQKSPDGFVYYNIYAWLSPLIIVVISMIVDLIGADSLKATSLRPFYGQYKVCWLTGQGALWVFVAFPILILTAVNLILLITAGYKRLKTSENSQRPLARYFKHKFAFGITYTIVLFLAWAFAFSAAYIHRNHHYTWVWYLFIVFNFLTVVSLHLVFFSCRFLPRILGREATFNLHSTDELTPPSSSPDTPGPPGPKINGHDNLAVKDKLLVGETSCQETAM